ncbi:MBL fold metallo-hydrolase [Antribacter gilvus]|uniref:MBL fold metallo-hydrolase n=1 Tax=Antribacter gilvus TaxID=2304675 RepID=UPI000F78B52A|nr:MBL fold metallo-hydrolase [Antribacter gilvus]
MQLTFHGHACVALTDEGTRIVIDPGTYSDTAAALAGATGVLVTHDHADHVDAGPVVGALGLRPGLEVWATGPAREVLLRAGAPADRVHETTPGETFRVGDATVTAGGGRHAEIHRDVPRAVNVTYLVRLGGTSVYHPGDSFELPPPVEGGVDVLLTPVSAPWLKMGEVIDFTRATPARIVVPVHDAFLSELGHALTARWLDTPNRLGGAHAYVRLAQGESWHS